VAHTYNPNIKRLRQEDYKFDANLGYMPETPISKKIKTNKQSK
jgi:hypothetical protein